MISYRQARRWRFSDVSALRRLHTSQPSWPRHLRWWFMSWPRQCVLAQDGCFVVGAVRLDTRGVISIAVHPSWRRQGIASALLCSLKRSGRPLFAYIDQDNLASRQLFGKAGFTPHDAYDAPPGQCLWVWHE